MNTFEWLQVFVSYALQASLVVSTAWALDHWSSSSHAKAKVWTACFLSLIGLLFAGILLPRLQCLHPWSRLQPSGLLMVANTEYVIGSSLMAIWVLGVAVMLVRWIWHYRTLNRFIQSCELIPPAKREAILEAINPDQHCVNHRNVQFRYSPEELGPFCYQLHIPLVFLPPSLVDGNAEDRSHVVRHELAHLHTQHPMQFFLQRALQTILWFHPLVWVSGKRAALVREFVCDDAVTENGASTAAYLRTLLRIVEARREPHRGTFAIGRSASELRQRALRMTQEHRPPKPVRAWRTTLPVLLTTFLVSQLWLPTNPLVAADADWSRWPSWTAATLHTFDVSVPDFDRNHESRIHELIEDAHEFEASRSVSH